MLAELEAVAEEGGGVVEGEGGGGLAGGGLRAAVSLSADQPM